MRENQASPVIHFPQIVVAEALETSLPLEHTSVTVQVTGPVASVVVSQRFGNPLQQAAELDYLYPLPENAAITGFEIQVGQRRIQGDLQEQEAARNAYNEARGQGQRAGLFEQRRPNLFAVRLANIQPGETIQAMVRYQQRVTFEDDAYEFVYPMGITPKYDSPKHPEEGEGVHAPIARMHAPLVDEKERIGPVEISLAVDAGLPVESPKSPSHALETVRLDERRFQVRLAVEQIPDHDFVLRYNVLPGPAGEANARAAGWASGDAKESFFLATLVPTGGEDLQTLAETLPREFVFVLDRSGSMSGEPILQARNALRACLRALNPGDTFRILLFDNDLDWFQPEPLPVTQEQVERADAYLEKVQGRGGTEIVGALDAVLSLPAEKKRTRTIVFLTDGAVSAETRLLDGIRGRIGAARLFTFGIGPSVNRALLSRMAQLGRGRSSFLQLNEDIEGAIIRFQDSVSFPALVDLTLEWENGKAWDVYPAQLPDLYAGQPLEISGRLAWSGAEPVKLTLRGKRPTGDGATQPVTIAVSLPQPAGRDPAVERLWAKARVDDLLEQMELEPRQADKIRVDKIRAEILGLALTYNLVTVYTSFVAIDRVEAIAGGQPRIIHVAHPLPQGLQPGPFYPGVQPMAMMSAGFPGMPGAPNAPTPAPAVSDVLSRGRGFLAKFTNRDKMGDSARLVNEAQPVIEQGNAGKDREALLRWLARTQKLDGSWNGDLEWTSAALLAFVRAGYTTRAGIYRQALRRAARFLVEYARSAGHSGDGAFARFLRARALAELAEATGDDSDRAAAQASRLALPAPVSDLDAAALGQTVQAPAQIRTLDDLRLAAMVGLRLAIPAELMNGARADLARTWAALLPGETK